VEPVQALVQILGNKPSFEFKNDVRKANVCNTHPFISVFVSQKSHVRDVTDVWIGPYHSVPVLTDLARANYCKVDELRNGSSANIHETVR
jgi:hypothetical protein